jgi:Kdo2-lipid IVA lauroyltransferase/acyltransferase
MDLIGFLIGYPFLWLLSLLPLNALYVISDYILFPVVFHIVGYRKKVVYENLRNSFPEKNESEIDTIARKFYKYFCSLFVEVIKLINISDKEYKQRVKYSNPEVFEELYKKGLNVIAATAHYCNWEWLSGITDSSPYRNMSLYKPLSNKYLEKVVTKMRTRFGADLVPMEQVARKMLSYKHDGILTASCFISDQTPISSHINYWTTFLNQDTPVFLGVEKLARSLKQAVVYLKMVQIKRGYYEFEIVKLYEDVSNVKDYQITEAHVRELEKQIIAQPEFWLWTHRRWKHKKPSHVQG